MNRKPIVAIDGPAASGKSTTAKIIGKELGLLYVDSGAMYRAVTLHALNSGIDTKDYGTVIQLARESDITFKNIGDKQHVFLNGQDVTEEIRTPEVTKNIAPVAANSGVRAILVEKQKEFAKNGGLIMDGRDIGTVVFPNADIKIFLVATPEARAKRRMKEFEQKGIKANLNEIIEDLKQRDKSDYSRAVGPLKKADDAFEVDNSEMSIEEQVNFIINIIKEHYYHDSDM